MTKTLAKAEVMPPPETPTEIASLLQLAIEKGVTVEALEKLVALHERVSDRMAAQEFNAALSRFQRECPPIRKSSTAKIATNSGANYSYSYAELDEIARTVNPILGELGLSYTWDSSVNDGLLRCVCTLRHVNGHSVSATFESPVDSAAKMSGAQKHAAALTFARRQSLVQVLGLTTCDADTAAAIPQEVANGTITVDQADDLRALAEEAGADMVKFLAWAKVSRFEDIPSSRYRSCLAALEAKRRSR